MEIQIITKKITGRMIQNLIPSPSIFEKHLTRCILHIKLSNFNGQEALNVRPRLMFGEHFNRSITGSQRALDVIEEQDFVWNFIPYESGKNQIQLIIYGLNPDHDVVFDDYNSRILFNDEGLVIYSRTFNVYSFTEYLILWFAVISTIGAIAEIINLILTHNIYKYIFEIFSRART